MTAEEKKAGNEMIAVFMGNLKVYQILKDSAAELKSWIVEDYQTVSIERAKELLEENKPSFPNAVIEINHRSLRFHQSWDWLIPAGKKWDDLFLNDGWLKTLVRPNPFMEKYKELSDELDFKVACYEIEPVFEQLVRNIKWYNENKPI